MNAARKMAQQKCSDQLVLRRPVGPTGSEWAAGSLQGLYGAAAAAPQPSPCAPALVHRHPSISLAR